MNKAIERIGAGMIPAVLISLMVGCGGGDGIASVEGVVTMDGKPVPNATVVFVPEAGGRPAGAVTDDEGRYELNFSGGRKGTIPGKNRVRVTTKSDPYEDVDGNPVPASAETIPVEYNQESTLEFDVVDGETNVANFDLKSGGRVVNDGGY